MAKSKGGCGGCLTMIVIAVVISGLWIGYYSNKQARKGEPDAPQSVAAASPAPAAKEPTKMSAEEAAARTPEKQAERKRMIEDLQAKGVFGEITIPGTSPRIEVRPAFYLLDFKQKQAFVGVVLAYYHYNGNNSLTIVKLVDSKSGKVIGDMGSLDNRLDLK